jgi:hypothetical protein
MFNGEIELYIWGLGDDPALKTYPTRSVEGIKLLSGAKLERSFDISGGKFSKVNAEKTVKAILVDTDTNLDAGESLRVNIDTTKECS